MSPYRITFHNEHGGVHEERILVFRDDDDAIDQVGSEPHPHAITVTCDNRTIARFPPWPRNSRPF
jgi:hypothetical protein